MTIKFTSRKTKNHGTRVTVKTTSGGFTSTRTSGGTGLKTRTTTTFKSKGGATTTRRS